MDTCSFNSLRSSSETPKSPSEQSPDMIWHWLMILSAPRLSFRPSNSYAARNMSREDEKKRDSIRNESFLLRFAHSRARRDKEKGNTVAFVLAHQLLSHCEKSSRRHKVDAADGGTMMDGETMIRQKCHSKMTAAKVKSLETIHLQMGC